MVWFIVFICIIALCGLIYLFLPIFKKLKGVKPVSKSKEKKEVKQSIKQDKKQQKEDKKLERKRQKQEKSEVKEASQSAFEDPDTKVIQNNLDLDGFFNNDFSSAKKEKYFNEKESLKSSYDDAFEDFFSNERFDFSNNKRKIDPYNTSEDNFYGNDISGDDDISDFLNEDYFSDKKDMAKMIKDLPPEIKAIMLSDVFDKKDI